MSRQESRPCTVKVNDSDHSSNLREHDVVCEKGRGDHERWSGNKLYRYLINVHKESYNELTPMERSSVIGKIINTIKDKGGWFVTQDEKLGKWGDLSEEKVRKKVSDDLRREVRRRREKRSNSTVFSAKLKALKEKKEATGPSQDILKPVNDPQPVDVLFGPGARRHPGNKSYWSSMKINLDQYIISPYGARSMISRNIVQGIRDQAGRFLEQDPKTAVWYEISDKRAIEKTSHALSNKKYKTRKKNPEDQTLKVSSEEDFGFDEYSDCSSDKASASSQSENPEDSPRSKTKSRTKKGRLLERMGGPTSIDSEIADDEKEYMASLGTQATRDQPARATSPPERREYPTYIGYIKGEKSSTEERAVVSPNDSRSTPTSTDTREEYPEYNGSRGYASILKRAPPVPMVSDYGYGATAEIEPRVVRYEGYAGDEYYPTDRVGYKPATLGRPYDEYGASAVQRGLCLPITETRYLAPRSPSAQSPYNSLQAHRLAKSRGVTAGYWSEWGASRRGDEYSQWR